MWHLVFRLSVLVCVCILSQFSFKFSSKISINKQPLVDKISNARLPSSLVSRCSDNSFQATEINQKTLQSVHLETNLCLSVESDHLPTIPRPDSILGCGLWVSEVGGDPLQCRAADNPLQITRSQLRFGAIIRLSPGQASPGPVVYFLLVTA